MFYERKYWYATWGGVFCPYDCDILRILYTPAGGQILRPSMSQRIVRTKHVGVRMYDMYIVYNFNTQSVYRKNMGGELNIKSNKVVN